MASRSARLIRPHPRKVIMSRLLQADLLTAGIGLCHAAPASAQVTLQLDAAIPPGMAEAVKQYGIEIPQNRVKGVVHIQQGADGSLDLRFNKADDTSEPKQAARNEWQDPAAAPALPAPPAPQSSQARSHQACSEAPIPQEPKATAAVLDG